MGAFEDMIKQQVPKPHIVKAVKKLHKGFLFGHISNGGGTLELEEGYALKFVALDDKFIEIYLLDYGKNKTIKTQTWQKSKMVNKPKEEKIEIATEVKKSDLF